MTIDTSILPKVPINISYDTKPTMATINNEYSISFDSTTMVDDLSSTLTYNHTAPITITTDPDPFGVEWTRKTFDKWPTEVVIEDMITKYPGLKVQYEKFMTVYNLVKDDYTYEGDE
jgi:hypothetical protein|tara:strand:- start:2321 stop:2671 length:351 start_codon:yes stop_codon:yes gene_type:complete